MASLQLGRLHQKAITPTRLITSKETWFISRPLVALVPPQAWPSPINRSLRVVAVEDSCIDEWSRRIDVRPFRRIKLAGNVERHRYDREDKYEDERGHRHCVRYAAEEGKLDGWEGFSE